MGKHLKEIDFDKLTEGTEVFHYTGESAGIVTSKSGSNWRNELIHVKLTIPPNYCKCCNRGNKEGSYECSSYGYGHLKYKEYNNE